MLPGHALLTTVRPVLPYSRLTVSQPTPYELVKRASPAKRVCIHEPKRFFVGVVGWSQAPAEHEVSRRATHKKKRFFGFIRVLS